MESTFWSGCEPSSVSLCGADSLHAVDQGKSLYTVEDSADVDASSEIGDRSRIWHLAQVRDGVTIGADCIIGRGAYVGSGVVVGDRVKIQNQALVYEPASVGDGAFIGPAVVLTNDRWPRAVNPDGSAKSAADWDPVGVTILEGASIGARSVCVAPVTIGAWSLVAAGSVVTRDVPNHALVAGVPARRVGWVGRDGEPLSEESEGFWVSRSGRERFEERDGLLINCENFEERDS